MGQTNHRFKIMETRKERQHQGERVQELLMWYVTVASYHSRSYLRLLSSFPPVLFSQPLKLFKLLRVVFLGCNLLCGVYCHFITGWCYSLRCSTDSPLLPSFWNNFGSGGWIQPGQGDIFVCPHRVRFIRYV